MVIIKSYNEEDDILSLDFGNPEHSRELKNVKIILDLDRNDNIVGIEIFDFKKKMMETQEEIDKLFENKTLID